MKKLSCLVVLIIILGLIISGCIFHVVPPLGQDVSVDIVKDSVSYKTNLIAGQHTIAGSITVSNDDESLFIAYETVDNWLINETHLYVGVTILTNSAPGKFPYKHEELGGVVTDTYEIPLEDLGVGPCDKIYIAAHADLIDGTVAETGWAEGIKITLGKNWAMYFEYDIPCDFMISRMAISQFLEYSEDYGEEQARQMTVDWLKIQSEVEDAGIGEDGTTIWFEYKNGGIEAIFTHDVTQKKTTLERIDELKLILPKELFSRSNRVIPLSKEAISLDPFTSIFSNSAQTIRNKLLDIGYICGYEENAGVTVELMRNLFKYGVVFINTHGGLIKNSQVVMATGQEYDEVFSEIYKEEFESGDLVRIWIRGFWKDKPYFGITPSFIQNNAYELYPNTLIYIDACNSLKNTTMAEAFISKGAYTYCGWSTYIWAFNESEEKVFENLADKKMNIQEALNDVGNPYLLFYPSSGWNFCLIKNTVSNVVAISWTDHIPENSQNIEYLINVFWDTYPEATGYKIYKNVNGVVEEEPVYSGPGELPSDKNVVQWHDTNIVVGNTYSYYVAAYGDGWETAPSQETGIINSFLPPIYLVGPSDGDTINNSTPTFEWSPVGSNPEGCKNFGTTELWVKDLTADKELVWQIVFDDITTFSATYNQDGQASPLIPGHSYGWQVTSYGYAENMEDTISQSEYWEFTYSTANGPIHNLTKNTYYDTIQAALDDADNNNTIEVSDGTYYENVDVNKSLTIRSENGAEATIVQAADPNWYIFHITASFVTLNGFTIERAIGAVNILIESANFCNISNNTISGQHIGLYLNSSNDTIICNNKISNCTNGNIYLVYASNNLITQNEISFSSSSGINIDHDSDGNTINKNNISNNGLGINLDGGWQSTTPSHNTIFLNNFRNNSAADVYIYFGSSQIDNILNSRQEITYIYKGKTYTSYLGNYWSDYAGSDLNEDGIGDVCFYSWPTWSKPIIDNYPLMEPFENYY